MTIDFSVKDVILEGIVSKEKVFNRVSQTALFSKYLGITPKEGRLYKNPLREDNRAGCSFFRKDDNSLVFYDHAMKKPYDIFNVLRTKGYSYKQALVKIVKDFDLDLETNVKWEQVPPKPKIKKLFQVETIPFTKEGLTYWAQFGVTKKILHTFRVKQVERFYINKNLRISNTLAFAYFFEDPKVVKVYAPYETKLKWHFNGDTSNICGEEQLPFVGELVFITKSRKDVMTLYSLGYAAISPQSETPNLSEELVNLLKHMFDRVLILYDNDGEFNPPKGKSGKGKEQALKLSENTGIEAVFIPDGEPKDISDYMKKYNREKTKCLIKNLLK